MRTVFACACTVLFVLGFVPHPMVPDATAAARNSSATAPVGATRAGTLTPEMVVAMRGVGEVALSPDGSRVAYVVRVPRERGDKRGQAHQEIWVVAASGGAPRRYTPPKQRAWAPAFSPDGMQLAFLSNRPTPGAEESDDDTVDLFVMDVGGGEARRVTDGESSIIAYRWAPDGTRMAFTAEDAKTEEEKEDDKAGRDHVVVDANPRPQRLWLLDVSTGTRTRVTSNDVHVLGFDWTPDGTRVALRVTEVPRVDEDYMYSRLALVPAAGGVPAPLVHTQGKLGNPAVSPSGRWVAWLGASDLHDPFAGSVFVSPIDGGEAVEVTRGHVGVATSVDWSDDQTLVVATTRGTETVLELVPRRGGPPRVAVSKGPVFGDVAVSRTGGFVALAGSTPACPAEVHAGRLEGGKTRLRRLTTTNPEIEGIQLGSQEVVRWRAADGLEIEGILVKPLGFLPGQRYPLVVVVHGGPEGCYTNGWITSYGNWTQLLASTGYLVLLPNYRGSIGRDESFERGDHGDLMGAEFGDILAGIDHLVERGWVDPERVGIGGGSYGGYTAAWAATAHPEQFAAAVDFCGITNWLSMQGTSDIPEENALVHWNRPFYENTDLYWERSPLAHVRDCRTPLLLLHGEEDARVPIGQSVELYTALRLLGREVEFVRYPREGHGLREAAHQLDFLQRSLAWFDRHLRPAGTGVSSRR